MRRSYLLLVALFAVAALPIDGNAQVNLPTFRNLATGELIERPYAMRYRQAIRDIQRSEYLKSTEKLMDSRDRGAAYAADACGIGCEDHEGLQIRGIPGTSLAAVVYKALLDDDVLTIQLRFHNDGSEPARLTVDPRGAAPSFYVQVGEQKLFILADDDGDLEAKEPLDVELEPGEIESWWARFPAPPRGTTAFDFHFPTVLFRDVPLTND
ncbi:MAG TPA: hypothetical protein VJ982_06905 [Gemmatimonadota bacterium]|nr:hypothetical protein [Gemmatimonadota bacterium]